MPIYAINYTLHQKQKKDYETLEGAIRGASNGNYLHCLDSFWIIASEHSAEAVYDHLAKFMKKDDSLMVHEMAGQYKCFLPKSKLEWIRDVLG